MKDDLRDVLAAEAAATWPEFSESLCLAPVEPGISVGKG